MKEAAIAIFILVIVLLFKPVDAFETRNAKATSVKSAFKPARFGEELYKKINAKSESIAQSMNFPMTVTERAYRPNNGLCEVYQKQTTVAKFSELKALLPKIESCWKERITKSEKDLAEEEQNGVTEGWVTEPPRWLESKRSGVFVGWQVLADCPHACGFVVRKEDQKITEMMFDHEPDEWDQKMKDFKLSGKSAITN